MSNHFAYAAYRCRACDKIFLHSKRVEFVTYDFTSPDFIRPCEFMMCSLCSAIPVRGIEEKEQQRAQSYAYADFVGMVVVTEPLEKNENKGEKE